MFSLCLSLSSLSLTPILVYLLQTYPLSLLVLISSLETWARLCLSWGRNYKASLKDNGPRSPAQVGEIIHVVKTFNFRPKVPDLTLYMCNIVDGMVTFPLSLWTCWCLVNTVDVLLPPEPKTREQFLQCESLHPDVTYNLTLLTHPHIELYSNGRCSQKRGSYLTPAPIGSLLCTNQTQGTGQGTV